VREAEVRLDTKLVAAGLVLVAGLVAAGLLFSALLGPQSLGSYSALPILALIGILFRDRRRRRSRGGLPGREGGASGQHVGS